MSKIVCERWCVAKWCVKDHVSKMVCDTVPCFHVTSTPFFMLAVPYQHASNPFLGADQGGIEWGGPVAWTVVDHVSLLFVVYVPVLV